MKKMGREMGEDLGDDLPTRHWKQETSPAGGSTTGSPSDDG